MAGRSAIKTQPKSVHSELNAADLKGLSFETIDLSESAFDRITKDLEDSYSTDETIYSNDSQTGSDSYSSYSDHSDSDEDGDHRREPEISLSTTKSLHELSLIHDPDLKPPKALPVVDEHGQMVEEVYSEMDDAEVQGEEVETEAESDLAESMRAPDEGEKSDYEKMREYKVANEPSCYFRDGIRRIDYILVFDTKSGFGRLLNERHVSIRRAYENKLRDQGLQLEYEESREKRIGRIAYVKIHATWEFLTLAAEYLNCEMPIQEFDLGKKRHKLQAKIKRAVTCNNKLRDIFLISEEARRPPIKRYYNMPYERELEECFVIDEKETFFSTVQRIRLVAYAIQRITIDISGKGKQSISLPEMVRSGIYNAEYPLHDSDCQDPDNKYHNQPVQNIPLRLWLTRYWASLMAWKHEQPLDDIWQYFGEKIAMYFAWLGVYTTMLFPAAIMGIIAVMVGVAQTFIDPSLMEVCHSDIRIICRSCQHDSCPFTTLKEHCGFARVATIFDNFLTPIFAFFISLWGVLFLNIWKRKQATLAAKWDAIDDEGSRSDLIRPEFKAKMKKYRTNPITRKEEQYMGSSERRLRMIFSAAILAVVYIGLIALFFALNLYRRYASKHFNHISVTNSFVRYISGDIIASLTTSCINLLMIFVLSALFSRLAWWLTHIECPRTEEQFEESFIYKRTLFEFVNNYGMLLYLALLKGKFFTTPNKQTGYIDQCSPMGCMAEVSLQLMVILSGKQIIDNLVIEMFWPSFKIWFRETFFTKSAAEKSKRPRWEKDHTLETLEQIGVDDYLEMVIQFGFITMFAPAFPLAPLFSILNNIVEIRIDASKYIVESRRPVPLRTGDIGPFMKILEVFTKISVITNAVVIAFTSDFLQKAVYISISTYTNLLKLSTGFIPLFVENRNASLAGFRQWSMSMFTTADYHSESMRTGLILGQQRNISMCFFPGFYQTQWHRIGASLNEGLQGDFSNVADVLTSYDDGNGTWSNVTTPFAPLDSRDYEDAAYYLRPEWWILMAFRLVFIIVFEHSIIALQEVVEAIVPDMPTDVELFEHREKFVRSQVVTKYRSKKKQMKRREDEEAKEKEMKEEGDGDDDNEQNAGGGDPSGGNAKLDPTKTIFGGRSGGQYTGGDVFTTNFPDVGMVEDPPGMGKRVIRRILCCFPFTLYGTQRASSDAGSVRRGNIYSNGIKTLAQNGFSNGKY